MATYSPILDTEIDAESPITESLMTRLRDNPLALQQNTYTVLTGSGNYSVPSNVSKLKVIMVSGGGGGGEGGDAGATGAGGGGGGAGQVKEVFVSTTGGASIAYSCGSGGSGGSGGSTTGNDGADGGSTTFGAESVSGGQGGRGAVSNVIGIGGNYPGETAGGTDKTFRPLYCGGHGGNAGGTTNDAYGDGCDGGSVLPVAGTPGAGGIHTGTASVFGGGGGGAPMALPFYIDGINAYLGAGGDGGDGNSAGSNATLNGAGGGGGGGNSDSGGDGSAGIIFVLPIG